MNYSESFKFKDYDILPIDKNHLEDTVKLLKITFPESKLTYEYLYWLYFENPRGFVQGYNAFSGDTLIAHYACVPIKIDIYHLDALLSVNTATHPDYQSRGLFKVLADKTYESTSQAFSCVVGVANRNSEKAFVRHLGFTKLGNLNLRLGFIARNKVGRRIYDISDLAWRSASPSKKMSIKMLSSGNAIAYSSLYGGLIRLKSEIIVSGSNHDRFSIPRFGFTVDWNRDSHSTFSLPQKLKPAPLTLIFRPLSNGLEPGLTSWSFPDFDVF